MCHRAGMQSSMRSEVTFVSAGISCAAWHYAGDSHGKTCVVMGHGLGSTRDAGLAPYAERFAQAGFQVLVFDYRHLGDSAGEPRQLLTIPRQLADWKAALAFARSLPGVERVALWGTSFSGGHVIASAAADPNISAVVAQCPMLDGRAAFLQAVRRSGPALVVRVVALALLDTLCGWLGRPPVLIPIAAAPGAPGFLTAPDSLPGFLALSPPHARNELSARLALSTAGYRPVQLASQVSCPVLFQICETDTVAPPAAVEASARQLGARAEIKRYPIGHFDIYFGDHFERSVRDQLDFLCRHCPR